LRPLQGPCELSRFRAVRTGSIHTFRVRPAGSLQVFERMKPIPERLAGNDEGQIPAASDGPLVIRGLVADWPSVAAGQRSARDLADYILQFDDGRPVDVMVGPPEIAGRFFYRDDMRGFNFH